MVGVRIIKAVHNYKQTSQSLTYMYAKTPVHSFSKICFSL